MLTSYSQAAGLECELLGKLLGLVTAMSPGVPGHISGLRRLTAKHSGSAGWTPRWGSFGWWLQVFLGAVCMASLIGKRRAEGPLQSLLAGSPTR